MQRFLLLFIMKLKHLFLILSITICCYSVNAQHQSTIDSLSQRLRIAIDDSNKVYLLDKLSFEYSYINPNEGIKYGNEALLLAQKLRFKKGMAFANCELSLNYAAKSEQTLALGFAQKSLKLFSEIGYKKGEAAVLYNITGIYRSLGDFMQAQKYAFQSLKIYEALKDSKNSAVVLEHIGAIYQEQNMFNEAKDYYTASYNINKKNKDRTGIARNLGNLAIIFNAKGEFDSAISFTRQAYIINEEIGNKHGAQINLANLGNAYFSKRDLQNALNCHQKALAISEETGHKNCQAINHGNLGEIYLEIAKNKNTAPSTKSRNLALAITHLQTAIQLCKEIDFPAPQLSFMKVLKEAFVVSGNHEKALALNEEYIVLKDSIFSLQSRVSIEELESKRRLGINESNLKIKNIQLHLKELELSHKKNQLTIYIISTILLIIVLGVLINGLFAFKKSFRRLKVENTEVANKYVNSEFRLKQAQAMAHIGNWTIPNLDSGITIWSEEMCRIYGVSPEVNQYTFEEWLAFIHPEDAGFIISIGESSIKDKEDISLLHRIIRTNGEVRYLFSRMEFEKNSDGSVGCYGICHDISELIEKEEKIRLSNERFELINKASREAMMDWDIVTDTTIWGNGFSEFFGYTTEMHHSHLMTDNIHPDEKFRIKAALQEVLDDPKKDSFFIDFRFLKADRTVAYVQLRSVYIRDKEGKAIRSVASIMDVTALVEKNKAIEKQNMALKQIAWSQSHEVRAPLTNIMALVKLFNKENLQDPVNLNIINMLQESAEKLDAVVTKINHQANSNIG